jgi:hypothetical protein
MDSALPSSGQYGTRVNVSGTGLLLGGTRINVTVGGAKAEVTGFSDTHVLFVVPSGLAAGPTVIAVQADTGANIGVTGIFSILSAGNITTLLPPTGHPGTYVEIRGVGLLGGGNTIVSVHIGPEAAMILNSSNERVYIRVQNSGVGIEDVLLTSDTGALVKFRSGFERLPSAAVHEIYPSSGKS